MWWLTIWWIYGTVQLRNISCVSRMRYRSNSYIYILATSDAGISPQYSTRRLVFSVLYVIMLNVHRPIFIDSVSTEVSGHGIQIEDTNGDEVNGLDECSLLLLCLLGMYLTNGMSNRYLCYGLLRGRSKSDCQYTWVDHRWCKALWAGSHLVLVNSFLWLLRLCMTP